MSELQRLTKPTIKTVDIEQVMRGAYIDYAMSVIKARALPDARDGLKIVQRRVLYGMKELGLQHDKPQKKSARIVGEVLGKLHPHGDTSVYEAMVRMAQPWILRYTLIEGQGNFGSVDGDPPAAMRYTEARLSLLAQELMVDLHQEIVAFQANFDASLQEPSIFPAKVPNLLINGASGIAVGMATHMPPHNLKEVIQGIIAYIRSPEITPEELMKHITAPDFPTGGIIYGYQGVQDAYKTGKGRIVLRARAKIETGRHGKQQIIVTELPYLVNKADMITQTAHLVESKKLTGIADLRDESDKEGLRVVYDIKRDAIANVVLNNLYKHTALQTIFSVNNVALVKEKPELLDLKSLIKCYVDHRHEVVKLRTEYGHRQASQKLHILEGYLQALDNLDPIILIIKSAQDPRQAQTKLINIYKLSETQAKAVLDMRLQRLTGLERAKILHEHTNTQKHLDELNVVLTHEHVRMQLIQDELKDLATRYGDERKTTITHDARDLTIEDIVPDNPMVITISNQGYIKRTPLASYKTQKRGGVGTKGVLTKKEDFSTHLFVASTHDYLLIFTASGRVYWKKVYDIPEGGKNSQGRAIQNLLAISIDDQIQSVLKVRHLNDPEHVKGRYVTFCTVQGIIKKTPLAAYAKPRAKGIQAITTKADDRLLEVKLTTDNSHIVLGTRHGKAVHFMAKEVRAMGRTAVGVRSAILNDHDDRVLGMVTSEDISNTTLLVLTERGYGKRSPLRSYRITKRRSKGIKTLQVTAKTGKLVAIKAAKDSDQLMIFTQSGLTLRIEIDTLRIMRRATQGVRLIRLRKDDIIAAVAKVENLELAP